MAQSLYGLLHECTVKLVLPKLSQGTGFFVAPGFILTCAHVVDAAQKQSTAIEVHWGSQIISAHIEEFRDTPYPDLALLRANLPTHPCVLLRGGAEPFSQLYSYGYPDNDPESAASSVTFESEGWAGRHQELLKFKLGQVRPGRSGSPLFNRETGTVCGIVQITLDRNSMLGGKGLLTQAILREFPQLDALQQRFHQQDKQWIERLTQQQRNALGLPSLPSKMESTKAVKIFFSYHPNDSNLRDELAKHLKPMQREKLITGWYAGNTEAGEEEKQIAKEHLDEARIILLLVSPDLLASDYHYDVEMAQALERHQAGTARVIPIILKPTEGWEQTELKGLLSLPRDGRPVSKWSDKDDAFAKIAREIRNVATHLQSQTPR
jgi:hypothetical protein